MSKNSQPGAAAAVTPRRRWMPVQYRRTVTIAVALIPLVIFAAIGMTVTVPYVAEGPGPTANTLGTYGSGPGGKQEPILTITGVPVDQTSGHLNLTTVSVTDSLTLFGAIAKWFDPDQELVPRELVYPPGKSTEETNQENVQMMQTSEDSAIVAALKYLKLPVDTLVGGIADDGAAKGKLQLGDVITAVDSTPVTTADTLTAALKDRRQGDNITLAITRAGKALTVPITLGKDGRIGIAATEGNANPNLKITLNTGDIGGPSAGLMMTLGIIDMLSPGELTAGKFIAGTGTIDPAGEVGPIGGITHKMKAARDAGATVFLVPADNCSEAKSDTPKGLQLVKIDSLTDATQDLAALGANKPVDSCS